MERVRASLRRFLKSGMREGDWVTVVAPWQQLWWTARNAWEYRQLAGVVDHSSARARATRQRRLGGGACARVRHPGPGPLSRPW